IEKHLPAARCKGACRTPHFARRIKDGIAADQQIVLRTDGETGRAAEADEKRLVDLARLRIDLHDPSDRRVSTYLRDGKKELAGAGMPHRLLGAILGIDA